MYNNRKFEINENQVADFLRSATERVNSTENIDVLADLAKLFKKNVPLSRRKYVIAYMLKESLRHYHPFTSRNDRVPRRNDLRAPQASEPQLAEDRPRHPRVEIDPSEATSIFISIGKNRRVYPRDLVGILIAVAGIDRERIGDIKVLANYSFVQLYTADAQTAIDKLNGYDYRGRKLAVSYSRQKSEEESPDAAAVATENPEFKEEEAAQSMSAEDAAAYAAAEKAAADKEPFGV